MKGMTKEGLMGWEQDNARYEHTPLQRDVIEAYRLLKRADRMSEAMAVRATGNQLVMRQLEIEEIKRLASESKIGQTWEEFIKPFALLDPEQLAEWIANFKEGVKNAKTRLAQEKAVARGQG